MRTLTRAAATGSQSLEALVRVGGDAVAHRARVATAGCVGTGWRMADGRDGWCVRAAATARCVGAGWRIAEVFGEPIGSPQRRSR